MITRQIKSTVKVPHASRTKGSWYGHLFRRLIHISMLVIPLIYYPYGHAIAAFFHLTVVSFLLILLVVALFAEFLRISFGVVLFGQRGYESKQISAFAWGMFSIVIVLLISPGLKFSVPIIWSLSLADPLMGEMRRIVKSAFWVEFVGVNVVLAIWWGCAYWFSLSLWWGVLLAPLTVAAEWLDLKWIDDNALMLLVPLIVVMIVSQF